MRLIKIKLKKAFESFKRDGFITTAGRVGEAVCKSLKPVGSGEILIVTGAVGDSARYRADHSAEYLNLNGKITKVTTQDNPCLRHYASRFNEFVFHRVVFDKRISKFVEQIKNRKKKIIFDIDDLVYDPQYLKYMDYYLKMTETEKEFYKNGVGGEILADPYVRDCTAATEYLSQKLRDLGKNVQVIRNRLSLQDQEYARTILEGYKQRDDDQIRLGYFSGTRSHDKDFETITEPLLKVLAEFKDARLVIVGPLNLNSRFKDFKEQIIRLPFVSRKKHFKNISSIDINLIPLEIGNPFCESKSEVKYIEAGILAKPSVTSATQTFKQTIENNVDGLITNNSDEWHEGLVRLIESSDLRKQMGLRAQKKVLAKYSNHKE